jgi:hypothetical protein
MKDEKTERKVKQAPDLESRPDAWERFERAVDAALRTPAEHRVTKVNPLKKKARPAPGYQGSRSRS